MTTAFLSRDIWSQLTKSTSRSRQLCDVALAYFGQALLNTWAVAR
jgi:hypothetical protein